MATEKHANSPTPSTPSTAWATITAAINASETALALSTLSPFPASVQFRILIDNELMLVTALPGGLAATVTRGVEGTTASAHSSGASVYHVLSAAALARSPRSMTTLGDIEYLDSNGAPARLGVGTVGQVLTLAGGLPSWASPISLATQTANTIFAGPTSGGVAAPTFRALVNADLGTTLTPTFAGLTLTGALTLSQSTTIGALTVGQVTAAGAAVDVGIYLTVKGDAPVVSRGFYAYAANADLTHLFNGYNASLTSAPSANGGSIGIGGGLINHDGTGKITSVYGAGYVIRYNSTGGAQDAHGFELVQDNYLGATIDNMIGATVRLRNWTTGTITTMTGFETSHIYTSGNYGAGTIGTVYHFRAGSTNNVGGTIVAAYGLKVEDQTGATTNYAIKTGVGLIDFNGARVSLAGHFTTSGANALILTTTGPTDVTLPTSGTLVTLAGVEVLSNKTLTAAGYHEFLEMTPPGVGAANTARLYADDSGGKTRLMLIFQSGAAIQLAIEV